MTPLRSPPHNLARGPRWCWCTGPSPDSIRNTALVQRQYPTGQDGETAVEFVIDPARFRGAFAADLPTGQTAVMAATQRPVAASAFTGTSGPAGWKTLPSWAVVAEVDGY